MTEPSRCSFPRRNSEPLRPRHRVGHHRRCARRRCRWPRRSCRRRDHRRPGVPQRCELRCLHRPGRRAREARAPHRQVAGDDDRLGMGVAPCHADRGRDRRSAPAAVDGVHRQLPVPPTRLRAELARAARRRSARRPTGGCRFAVVADPPRPRSAHRPPRPITGLRGNGRPTTRGSCARRLRAHRCRRGGLRRACSVQRDQGPGCAGCHRSA